MGPNGIRKMLEDAENDYSNNSNNDNKKDSEIVTNPNTNTNNNSAISQETISNINGKIITETIVSTNTDTNKITIEKRTRYLEERTQRAYYIKNHLLKKLEKHNKKYNIDKSDIVNDALELYFNLIDKS